MALVIDTATPALKGLRTTLADKADLNKVMATAGRNVIQKHFAGLAMGNRNKFGRPATFWKRMRGATMADSSATMSAVVMEREVAQRRFGGTIKPTGGRKYLTIPMSGAAYGKAARSIKGTFFIKLKPKMNLFIARAGKSGKLELLFALVKSATQKANKAILPSDQTLTDGVKKAIAAWVKLKTKVQ